MSNDKHEPSVQNFFIYNLTLGQREGFEHEKLLYYHPPSQDIDTKVKNIGLAEAITRFTLNFSNKQDCESVHTQKTRQIFYQPEPDIWMVMTVNVGWVRKTRDSGPVREYKSEGLQDPVLKSRLVNSYKYFQFLYHSFKKVEMENGLDKLKDTLMLFYDDYLKRETMSTGDILTLWSGVSFLPLDRQTFLQVHCCLSVLESSLPIISHSAFLYNSNIVWCGLELEDLRPLSHYLQTILKDKENTSNSTGSNTSSKMSYSSYLSRFVGSGSLPHHKIFLKCNSEEIKSYYLLIYSLAGASICIILPDTEKLSMSIYEKIAKTLDAKVSQIASDIGEQINKKNATTNSTDNFKYFYHNQMNLATKTSHRNPNYSISSDVMQTLVDMHIDMLKHKSSELIVKTSQDHWVVGRSGNGREYYVIINHKNANLVEITDEVNRMCASHFNNIFMIH